MKRLLANIILGTATMFILTAYAQPKANTFYGKADLGGSVVQDTELQELFGPVFGDNEVEFDAGVRFGLGFGYNITEWFAAEAELGMNWNEIDKMGGAQSLDAMFINMPFLVNAKLQLPNPSIVRPYVGVGVGGASSVVDIDHLVYRDVRLTGSASDVTFAWQGFAGVQFDLNEQMSLGLEYRYLWSDAPEFDIDWGWFWNIETDHMAFDEIETHSISLIFSYQF